MTLLNTPRLAVIDNGSNFDAAPPRDGSAAARASIHDDPATLRFALVHARQCLLAQQRPEGGWTGEQQGDPSLTAKLILLDLFLNRNDEKRTAALARSLRNWQAPSGAWAAKPGGPTDLSVSLLAYFSLKTTGLEPADEGLYRARKVLRPLGGVEQANDDAHFWLTLFGQTSSPVQKRTKRLSPRLGVAELRVGKHPIARQGLWRKPLRRPSGRASESAARLLRRRIEAGDNAKTAKNLDRQIDALVHWEESGEVASVAPTITPRLDTLLTLHALLTCRGDAKDSAIARAIDSLFVSLGDPETLSNLEAIAWVKVIVKLVSAEEKPEGQLLPRLQILDGLSATPSSSTFPECRDFLLKWGTRIASILARRQRRDGGWSLKSSPSNSDVTGQALHALALWNRGDSLRALNRGVRFLRKKQRDDGSWKAAWGIDAIFGTSCAIEGLAAAGVSTEDPAILAGVNWLLSQEQPSGGWGGGIATVDSSSLRRRDANVTASQTAWALGGLLAAGFAGHAATRRAVDFLIETQEDSGDWHEPHFTLKSDAPDAWRRNALYPSVFALEMLSRFARIAPQVYIEEEPVRLRLADVGPVDE